MNLQEKLRDLNESLFTDLSRKLENGSHFYLERLEEVHSLVYQYIKNQSQEINQTNKELIAIAYYNICKINNSPKTLKQALKYCPQNLLKFHWNLQLTALISSCGNNLEAHEESISLIAKLTNAIESLELPTKLNLLRRQILEITNQQPQSQGKSIVALEQKIKQIGDTQKIPTDCPLINKKFHIADIMSISSINPNSGLNKETQSKENQFFTMLIYLSISYFTRATQRYYCYLHDEKEYHWKAMKIASYLYSEKAVYLRFLKRTFLDHYKKDLFPIEEVEEDGDIRRKIEPDPTEISLITLPWDDN